MASAAIAASIKAGFVQLIADTGTSATYGGNAYTVAMGVRDAAKVYDPLGEMEGYTNTLSFLTDELTANADTPEAGDQVTIDGSAKRILKVTTATFGEITRIDVGDLY
jgi:hypothetical protein